MRSFVSIKSIDYCLDQKKYLNYDFLQHEIFTLYQVFKKKPFHRHRKYWLG